MIPSSCSNAALRRATRRLGQLYDDVLKPSGLKATQFTLLSRLIRYGSPTMGILAAELVMDRSALSHTLAPLIARGLVRHAADPADRRSRRVSLTDKGRRTLDKAEGLWQQAEGKFESAFGAHAAIELRRLLDQIATPDFAAEFRKR